VLFWIIAACLTAMATLGILIPLSRHRQVDNHDAEASLRVYKDQLEELERDKERGVLEPEQAEAARIEISRRLLKASEASKSSSKVSSKAQYAKLASMIAIPLVSLGLYFVWGSPGAPDMPLQARLEQAPEGNDVSAMVARVESHLEANPNDSLGWRTLAPIYARMGRLDDAERAYLQALSLGQASAELYADLGEVQVALAQGRVSESAQLSFQKALELSPDALGPKFFLALGLSQQGKTNEATQAWQDLLQNAPDNAPWRGVAEQELAKLRAPDAAAPALSAEVIEAASQMSDSDREDMIAGMVERLENRLKSSPDDLEGWKRLIRAYAVLNNEDKAAQALSDARLAFAGNENALKELEALNQWP
jgi:cytochrome c-type biogenesis protein CcmH